MKQLGISVLALVFLAGTALAQTSADTQADASASQSSSASADTSGAQANSQTSANGSQNSQVSSKDAQASAASQLQNGSTIHAVLANPVDARKNKPGDQVVAKSTQDVKSEGKTVIPRGSKIIGHVTEAKPRAKGQENSELGMVFDHAILKDGTEVPLPLSVQAVGRSAAAVEDQAAMPEPMSAPSMPSAPATSGRASGGLVGGAQSTASGATATAGSTVGAAGNVAGGTVNGATGTTASGMGHLSPANRGVVGLPGMNLSSGASNASMLTSSTSNVHLDSGTEMILSVTRQ